MCVPILQKSADGRMWRYRLTDHEPRLLAEIQRQQNSNLFCDTLLQTSGVSIPAHSCILAALSPYLSEKVSASPSSPSTENRRRLQLRSLSGHTLVKLVGLLYSGELKLEDPTEREEVLAAARRLRIGGLVEVRRDGRREREVVVGEQQQSRRTRGAETQAEIRVGEAGVQTVKCNEQATAGGSVCSVRSSRTEPLTQAAAPCLAQGRSDKDHCAPSSSNLLLFSHRFNPNDDSTVVSTVEETPNSPYGGTWNWTDTPLVTPNTPKPPSPQPGYYTTSDRQETLSHIPAAPQDTNPESVEELPEEIERFLEHIMMIGLDMYGATTTTTPQSSVPHLDRATTTTPQSSVPHLDRATTTTPQSSVPHLDRATTTTPQSSVPHLDRATTTTPQSSVPHLDRATTTTLQSSVPHLDRATTTTPQSSVPHLDRATTTTPQSSVPNLSVSKQGTPHPAVCTDDRTASDDASLADTGFHSACTSHFVPAKRIPERYPDFTHHPETPQRCPSTSYHSSTTAHSLRRPARLDERSFQNTPGVAQSAPFTHDGQPSRRPGAPPRIPAAPADANPESVVEESPEEIQRLLEDIGLNIMLPSMSLERNYISSHNHLQPNLDGATTTTTQSSVPHLDRATTTTPQSSVPHLSVSKQGTPHPAVCTEGRTASHGVSLADTGFQSACISLIPERHPAFTHHPETPQRCPSTSCHPSTTAHSLRRPARLDERSFQNTPCVAQSTPFPHGGQPSHRHYPARPQSSRPDSLPRKEDVLLRRRLRPSEPRTDTAKPRRPSFDRPVNLGNAVQRSWLMTKPGVLQFPLAPRVHREEPCPSLLRPVRDTAYSARVVERRNDSGPSAAEAATGSGVEDGGKRRRRFTSSHTLSCTTFKLGERCQSILRLGACSVRLSSNIVMEREMAQNSRRMPLENAGKSKKPPENKNEKMKPGTSSNSHSGPSAPGTSSNSHSGPRAPGRSSNSHPGPSAPGTSSNSHSGPSAPGRSSNSHSGPSAPGRSSNSHPGPSAPGRSSNSHSGPSAPGRSSNSHSGPSAPGRSSNSHSGPSAPGTSSNSHSGPSAPGRSSNSHSGPSAPGRSSNSHSGPSAPGTSSNSHSGPSAPGRSSNSHSGPSAPGRSSNSHSGPSAPGRSSNSHSGPSAPGRSSNSHSGPSAPGRSSNSHSGPSAPGRSSNSHSGPSAPGRSSNSHSGPSAPGRSSNSHSGPSAPGRSSNSHSGPSAPGRSSNSHSGPSAPGRSSNSHSGPSAPGRSGQSVDLKRGRPREMKSTTASAPKRKRVRRREMKSTTGSNGLEETLSGRSTLVRSVQSLDSLAPKRKRGRPRLTTSSSVHSTLVRSVQSLDSLAPKRKRGRPRLTTSSSVHSVDLAPKRKVGRPRKIKQDHNMFLVAPSSDSSHVPSSALCDIAAQISDKLPKSNSTPEEQNESTPEHAEGARVIKTKRPPTVTLRQFQELIQHRHWRTRESKRSNDGAESQEEVSCGTESSHEESARESEIEREGAQTQGKGEVKTIGTVHGFPFDQNPHRIITAETCGSQEADKKRSQHETMHEKKQQGHQSQNKNYISSETVTEKEGEESSNTCVFDSKEAVVNDVPSEETCQVADNGGEMGHPDEVPATTSRESDTERPADTTEDYLHGIVTERPADTTEDYLHGIVTERPADTTERPADATEDYIHGIVTERPADTTEDYLHGIVTERPADATEDYLHGIITERPADATEDYLHGIITERPADATEDYLHGIITERPADATEDYLHGIVTERPADTTEDYLHGIITERPADATEDYLHGIVTERPADATEDYIHGIVTERPADATEDYLHGIITERPADTTERPADTTERPADTTERPADTTERPADTTERPADTTERPADTTERPADTTERPADTTERPADTTERPADTTERPADTTERPADTTERPADTTERPADTTERPADTTERPADTTERPADTTERPADTTEDYLHGIILMLRECKLSAVSLDANPSNTLD